jgi:hypothetical protein
MEPRPMGEATVTATFFATSSASVNRRHPDGGGSAS